MKFEEALKIKIELSKGVTSKSYRVIPNPKTDSDGYTKFMAELNEFRNLTDEDAKIHSSNFDFEILEELKGITKN